MAPEPREILVQQLFSTALSVPRPARGRNLLWKCPGSSRPMPVWLDSGIFARAGRSLQTCEVRTSRRKIGERLLKSKEQQFNRTNHFLTLQAESFLPGSSSHGTSCLPGWNPCSCQAGKPTLLGARGFFMIFMIPLPSPPIPAYPSMQHTQRSVLRLASSSRKTDSTGERDEVPPPVSRLGSATARDDAWQADAPEATPP